MNKEGTRAMYPMLYTPAPENTAGIFAVMVLMSPVHYAMVVCLNDPEDEDRLEELAESLARAFWAERDFYVGRYNTCLSKHQREFALHMPISEYEYTILPFDSMGFVPLDETSIEQRRPGSSQYVFIAEPGVDFNEFMIPTREFLN